MGSQKRIAKVSDKSASQVCLSLRSTNTAQELAELVESPPEGIKVELANEANLYDWKVYMNGPEGSPFHVRHILAETNSTPD